MPKLYVAYENANTHAHGDNHLVVLAHLRRHWSLSGREGLGPLSLPPSLRGGIQAFSRSWNDYFPLRRKSEKETEANGGHSGDRTLDRTRSLFDRTRPVNVQRLCEF
jgi:hypothetical protein